LVVAPSRVGAHAANSQTPGWFNLEKIQKQIEAAAGGG
jgi:hypothetical protein